MNNPELYEKSNFQQKRDVQQCLEDYGKLFKWNKFGTTVIDIGCGDGSVTTSILKPFLSNSCKELVGCDINEDMVQFANVHHAGDFISFTMLDIEGDLPERLNEKFNYAFSFYTLHWIKHQEIAFSNIYALLASGGDCLLMFLGHMPVYDVWRELARSPRWNYWLKDVEEIVSPYHDCQDSVNDIKKMMSLIGFTKMDVKCLQKEFVYTEYEAFRNATMSINPFKFPFEMQDDFLEDYLKVVRDMQFVDHTYNNNVDGKQSERHQADFALTILPGKEVQRIVCSDNCIRTIINLTSQMVSTDLENVLSIYLKMNFSSLVSLKVRTIGLNSL